MKLKGFGELPSDIEVVKGVERAEMSARTAAVIAAAKQKNSEWETPDGPRDVAA